MKTTRCLLELHSEVGRVHCLESVEKKVEESGVLFYILYAKSGS